MQCIAFIASHCIMLGETKADAFATLRLYTPRDVDGLALAATPDGLECDCGFIDEYDITSVIAHEAGRRDSLLDDAPVGLVGAARRSRDSRDSPPTRSRRASSARRPAPSCMDTTVTRHGGKTTPPLM